MHHRRTTDEHALRTPHTTLHCRSAGGRSRLRQRRRCRAVAAVVGTTTTTVTQLSIVTGKNGHGQIDAYHTSTTFAQSAATAACVPVTLLRSNVPDRTRTPGVPDRRTRHSVPLLFFFFFFTSTHTHTRARVHIRTLAMASRLVCACWWWSSGGGPSLSCYRLNSILKKPIISDKSALGFYY